MIIDKGNYVLIKIDGKYRTCVSCGKPLEHDKVSLKANHHCSKAHENRRAGVHRSYQGFRNERRKTFGQRLSDGFQITEVD